MTEIKRVLGLDVGEKRIGVAVSDLLGITPQGLPTIENRGDEKNVAAVVALARQYETDRVLCGLPRNMDGSIGFQAKKVLALAEQLELAGLHVIYQDERLTTVTAERALIEGGMHREERKGTVDKVAAAVILQQYLDTLRNIEASHIVD